VSWLGGWVILVLDVYSTFVCLRFSVVYGCLGFGCDFWSVFPVLVVLPSVGMFFGVMPSSLYTGWFSLLSCSYDPGSSELPGRVRLRSALGWLVKESRERVHLGVRCRGRSFVEAFCGGPGGSGSEPGVWGDTWCAPSYREWTWGSILGGGLGSCGPGVNRVPDERHWKLRRVSPDNLKEGRRGRVAPGGVAPVSLRRNSKQGGSGRSCPVLLLPTEPLGSVFSGGHRGAGASRGVGG